MTSSDFQSQFLDLTPFKIIQMPNNEFSWISFQSVVVNRLLDDLELRLTRLCQKQSVKRVHDARVALRRWTAIWAALKEDGWESKKFRKQSTDPLLRLQKHLGQVRDLDVMLELCDVLKCKRDFVIMLKHSRRDARTQLVSALRNFVVDEHMQEMRCYVEKRCLKLENELAGSRASQEKVQEHLDFTLSEQEQIVKNLESQFDTPKGLHHFRLAVKSWRYILSELCGIKNATLEKTQTMLGEIHDLDTMQELLLDNGKNILALNNLRNKRSQLMENLPLAKNELPFGLRTTPNSSS